MYTMYKEDKVMQVDREQLGIMAADGWSHTKPEVKEEPELAPAVEDPAVESEVVPAEEPELAPAKPINKRRK